MNTQTLYDLTNMTGKKASSQRTVVLGNTEVRWRIALVGFGGLIGGLIVGLMFIPLFGGVGVIFIGPLVAAALIWLIEGRSKKGLQRSHLLTFVDNYKAEVNQYMLGADVIDPSETKITVLMGGSRPRETAVDQTHGPRPDRLDAIFGV